MRHQNSVFHQLTQQIPWDVFDGSVAAHGADHRVRRLRRRDQFLALLYGQLSVAQSLREIETGLFSWRARHYHHGARPISRSTLADANAKRPAQIYADLFLALVTRARPGLRRKFRDAVRLIDSSRLPLNSRSESWAAPIKSHHFAKIHIVYDPQEVLPLEAFVTANRVGDITPAQSLKIEAGATYVFDLAYYSYEWWGKLDAAGCRFVTRLKRFTQLMDCRDLALGEDPGAIVSDRIGLLSKHILRGKNPYRGPVREIVINRGSNVPLRLVTNDLEAPAAEISALYKMRWEIELFFKWIKQNLKLRHFIGTSENAVKIQIYVALIAFLLLRAAHRAQKSIPKLQAFSRLVRQCLMHRRNIGNMIQAVKLRPDDPSQFQLELSRC